MKPTRPFLVDKMSNMRKKGAAKNNKLQKIWIFKIFPECADTKQIYNGRFSEVDLVQFFTS